MGCVFARNDGRRHFDRRGSRRTGSRFGRLDVLGGAEVPSVIRVDPGKGKWGDAQSDGRACWRSRLGTGDPRNGGRNLGLEETSSAKGSVNPCRILGFERCASEVRTGFPSVDTGASREWCSTDRAARSARSPPAGRFATLRASFVHQSRGADASFPAHWNRLGPDTRRIGRRGSKWPVSSGIGVLKKTLTC